LKVIDKKKTICKVIFTSSYINMQSIIILGLKNKYCSVKTSINCKSIENS